MRCRGYWVLEGSDYCEKIVVDVESWNN